MLACFLPNSDGAVRHFPLGFQPWALALRVDFVLILNPRFSMTFETSAPIIHAAFGLRFRSRMGWLPLRISEKATDPADVEVTFGETTANVPELPASIRFEAGPGKLLFRTRTIADYQVDNGDRIHILPKAGADELRLANLLFGAVTGGLLIQRGTLALHGCSVETPAGAVIICGDSGAGKSTLSALLLERGLRILDDNIAALVWQGEDILVQPGLGYLRLTAESLALLGKPIEGSGFPAPYQMKYLHFLDQESFCPEARPLRRIVVLDRQQESLEHPIFRGADKLDVVRRFTFVRHMIQPLGQLESQFQRSIALTNRVPVSRLGQPASLDADTWAERVAEWLRQC